MSGKRQNIQHPLALELNDRGEAPAAEHRGPNHLWRRQHSKARL
jgi:hypothetical protein